MMAAAGEVRILMNSDDPALYELRKAVNTANRLAATGSRRRAFIAGWKLRAAMSRFMMTLRPEIER
jgi:hypothetical protein